MLATRDAREHGDLRQKGRCTRGEGGPCALLTDVDGLSQLRSLEFLSIDDNSMFVDETLVGGDVFQGEMGSAQGTTLGPDGIIYTTSDSAIYRFDPATDTFVFYLSPTGSISFTTRPIFDSSGLLYVATFDLGFGTVAIYRIDPVTDQLSVGGLVRAHDDERE